MLRKVKRRCVYEKRSVWEIVRLTSWSRHAVREWLKSAVLEEPRTPVQ